MKQALIGADGIVVQTVTETFPVDQPFVWVSCPDNVSPDVYRFDGKAFARIRKIAKSIVLSRLTNGQLDAALAMMTNRQKERWRSPDTPEVLADDPEVVGLINAIGADPNVVLK